MPAYLSDAGIAPAIGAWALALVGLFNVIGAYTAGVLGRCLQQEVSVELFVSRSCGNYCDICHRANQYDEQC